MRILFISRSGKHFETLPFIERQYNSLRDIGLSIDHYIIKEKGFKGYYKAYKFIKRNKNKYNIVHSHYSYTFIPCIMAGIKAYKVVSFMGSDLYGIVAGSKIKKYINIYLSKYIAYKADKIIVKSLYMKSFIPLNHHYKTHVIPNGVDVNKFKPISRYEASKRLGIEQGRYLLFLGRKTNPRKNYSFIEKNIRSIHKLGYQVLAPYPVDPELVPYYINISDVLVVPSLKEGSPNVIKEALACGKPVLSTDVGDVRELFKYSKTSSIFYDSKDFLEKLESLPEEGHEADKEFFQIYSLDIIARKIFSIYRDMS